MQKHEAEAHAERLRVETGKPHRAVETPEGFTVEPVETETFPEGITSDPPSKPASVIKPETKHSVAPVEKRHEAGLKHEEHRKHH